MKEVKVETFVKTVSNVLWDWVIMMMYKCYRDPTVTNGAETRTMTTKDINGLREGEMEFLRSIQTVTRGSEYEMSLLGISQE